MTGGRRRALERAQTATTVAALSLSTLAVGGLAFAPVAYAAPNDTVSLLKDIRAGATGSNPTGLVAVGGTVFFRARDSLANGYELWKSDGTAAGTEIVKDIFPGDDSLPTNLTNVGGTLYFQAESGDGYELWKSDGTAAGTVPVRPIAAGGPIRPTDLIDVDGTLFFSAASADGRELWKSDGTAGGTVQVANIASGSASSTPLALEALGDRVFFSADDGSAGRELWSSDGTPGGTVRVRDIRSGSSSSEPQGLTAVGSSLFFSADDGVAGRELWVSDGTTVGTRLVEDIGGNTNSNPDHLTNVNGTLFFVANDTGLYADHGTELWVSDGTAAGTTMVRDIFPSVDHSFPQALTAVGDEVLFTAIDGVAGRELWRSDGTEAGTTLVKDIWSGASAGYPLGLTNVGGVLFFQANDGSAGSEVWRSDGTAGGTTQVADIRPGTQGSAPASFTEANGRLFFTASNGSTGVEPWVGSDSANLDTTPPDTTVNSGPANGSTITVNSASFAFSGTPGDTASFECKIDAGTYAACTSPRTFSTLVEGSHTVSFRAIDAAGNIDPTPATVTFIVDTVAPDTQIDTGPAAGSTITTNTATFGFSGTGSPASFECKIDAGSFATCTSPKTFGSLNEGPHTIQFRAIDAAGNTDPSPATRSFTVDTVAPDTQIDTGPAAGSTITTNTATFGFSGTGSPASFECKIDAGSFATCTSPKTFTNLAEGPHTVQFRAIDAAGNTDPSPATRSFTVDTVAPDTQIDTDPAAGSTITSNSATFGFSGTGSPASFECKIDAGSFATCTSPKTFTNLAEGPHTVQFRAIDAAGNTDQSPATRSFTVDTVAPDTQIDTGPAAGSTITSNSATFGFSGTGSPASFECKIDTDPFTTCTSPKTFTNLAEGPHTVQFRAIDAAGNTDPSPATRSFTVDTVAPDTVIDSGPANGSTVATDQVTFTFSGTGGAVTYECKIDTGMYSECTSPTGYTGLDDGIHTFSVRGTDAVGNTDPTAASRSFTVDTSVPDTTAPDTNITDGPANQALIATDQASFSFTGIPAEDTASFVCAIDSGESVACTSPTTFIGLVDGPHTVSITAVDAVGNTDPSPATRTFAVDTAAPDTSIDSGPANGSTITTTSATFEFSGTGDPTTFECSIDDGDYVVCTSPTVFTDLSEGSHTVAVRASDSVGNADATPASRTFTVATPVPAPDNTFAIGAKGKPNTRTGTLKVAVTLPGPGRLEVAASGAVRGSTTTVAAGKKLVTLRLTRKGLKMLKIRRARALAQGGTVGKIKVKVRFSYTPTNGTRSTRTARYTFLLK
jgi:ELWxxDGT repeat protein